MIESPLYIHPAEARRRFKELAAGEIGRDQLAYGALLISLEDHPALDLESSLSALDALAERAKMRADGDRSGVFVLGHLRAILFDEEHFRGDNDHYHDIRNVYLDEVIERRIGLPITLSIIVLHVAWRLGLDAVGVGLPGHYLVRIRFDLSEVYLDPFHAGVTRTLPEIRELVRGLSGSDLRAEHLRAWDERETLVRVLANLRGIQERRGDARRARQAEERMRILSREE